jgi:phenol 2-monooxygenase (NADPH)
MKAMVMLMKGTALTPGRGCVVIIRPDQDVSWIGDLEDDGDMKNFFSAFMTESK